MKGNDYLATGLQELYGRDTSVIVGQQERYRKITEKFHQYFDMDPTGFFSTPGRTEISGNHTDHNHGRVIAAAVHLDAVAAAAKTDNKKITVFSDGYKQPFVVSLNHLEPLNKETGNTTALIRGIAAKLKELGYAIGGFNAVIHSDVLPGSGLSSSAAIEVLIGTIFNHLYNGGAIEAHIIAQTGQYAENYFFGKPCGLMDQLTCATGGIIGIDFKNPQQPEVEKIDFDFAEHNFKLMVVNTDATHANLTEEYAAIPQEMKAVAAALNKTTCREISMEELLRHLPTLRKKTGDRAVLRAMHFLTENQRVREQLRAFKSNDLTHFLSLVRGSGNSSFKWLQNIYCVKNANEQSVALALALTERFIAEIGAGACRVHGGGFAGTIQVFLPQSEMLRYVMYMSPFFGEESVIPLTLRQMGAVRVDGIH